MPGGYQFGVQLGFVSQNYGSDESVTITCDNDQLAALLGIDGLPNATRTETIEYNWQTFGIEGDPNNAANPPKPAQGTTAGYTGTETKFTKEGAGTLLLPVLRVFGGRQDKYCLQCEKARDEGI